MKSELDQLVVAASSLEAGSGYVANLLGVNLTEGGRHPEEGTHNRLLRLGVRGYISM